VIQLYRYPGLSESALKTLLKKVIQGMQNKDVMLVNTTGYTCMLSIMVAAVAAYSVCPALNEW
jgi:hypothetical protein